jgi:hypothetical protein
MTKKVIAESNGYTTLSDDAFPHIILCTVEWQNDYPIMNMADVERSVRGLT